MSMNDTLIFMEKLANERGQKLEQVKRFPVTCPVCGSSAIEYHYPNSLIEIICYGHCGNTYSN